MVRFVVAFAIGFALVSTVWYAWIWVYVDPDPYVGLMLAIAYLYLAPLVFAVLGLVAYLTRFQGGRADAPADAEPEDHWLRRGGPVFLGLLLGGALGSYAVTSGGS